MRLQADVELFISALKHNSRHITSVSLHIFLGSLVLSVAVSWAAGLSAGRRTSGINQLPSFSCGFAHCCHPCEPQEVKGLLSSGQRSLWLFLGSAAPTLLVWWSQSLVFQWPLGPLRPWLSTASISASCTTQGAFVPSSWCCFITTALFCSLSTVWKSHRILAV